MIANAGQQGGNDFTDLTPFIQATPMSSLSAEYRKPRAVLQLHMSYAKCEPTAKVVSSFVDLGQIYHLWV